MVVGDGLAPNIEKTAVKAQKSRKKYKKKAYVDIMQ
jgi:hypothetical protein